MYDATKDLILMVKEKTISVVPHFKSNFIWPDARGIKSKFSVIFSQFMVMVLMFATAFSRILQEKENNKINFYSSKILFRL